MGSGQAAKRWYNTETPVAHLVIKGWATSRDAADIPLPAGFMPPVDETDDLREELEAQNKGPDRWVELGLHTVH